MREKLLAVIVVLGPTVLTGFAASPEGTSDRKPATHEIAASSMEQTLLNALNAERLKAGKQEVPVSSSLMELARGDSSAAASTMKLSNNVVALQSQSGFSTIGKLQANFKDRGPQTGAKFSDFWIKQDRAMLLEDWSKIGVGISKSADGRLFAVVLLGRMGGGSLMNPGLSPGGLMQR